jgi:hypothetical protein
MSGIRVWPLMGTVELLIGENSDETTRGENSDETSG